MRNYQFPVPLLLPLLLLDDSKNDSPTDPPEILSVSVASFNPSTGSLSVQFVMMKFSVRVNPPGLVNSSGNVVPAL